MKRECDFCKGEAKYDAPTVYGPWAYMCQPCYTQFGNRNFTPTILANIRE